MKPPKLITVYATRPDGLSIIKWSTSPMLLPEAS
jgi:hypothetical protein